MNTEQQVAQHYGRGGLEQAILNALRESGKDPERIAPADLSAADEFHFGWGAQTVAFAEELNLSPDMYLLDIGAGIGGPARYFAEHYGCRVVGIDITDEFVQVANALTQRCRLDHLVSFQHGSALAMPFANATFDCATLIHVGMNIADKSKLFGEIRRVLKVGGRLGVYDIMRVGEEEIPYPMPWAATAETSFVESPETYRQLLKDKQFEIEKERSRADFSLELGRQMHQRTEREGVPPLGLHLLMGPPTPERLGNAMKALEQGIIAPIEMIGRAI